LILSYSISSQNGFLKDNLDFDETLTLGLDKHHRFAKDYSCIAKKNFQPNETYCMGKQTGFAN
jgi:hypothetical protein